MERMVGDGVQGGWRDPRGVERGEEAHDGDKGGERAGPQRRGKVGCGRVRVW